MTTVEELHARKRPTTFQPFVIMLKDGRRLLVNRPFQYAFNEYLVAVFDDGDRIVRFKPADITGFEQPQATTPHN